MSWFFEHTGDSREDLKAKVLADPNVSEWKYCPLVLAERMCDLVDAFGEPNDANGEYVMFLSTNGHISSPSSAYDSFRVEIGYRKTA